MAGVMGGWGKQQRGDLRQRLASRYGVRLTVPAMFIILLLLSGCAGKVKVVYVPSDSRPRQAKSGASKETVSLLKRHYEKWRGTPYVDGGMSASGLDCSGFTVLAYRDLFGLSLPRTASEQAEFGRAVAREDLEPGDLVFFQTGVLKRHVGIFLADDQFIHVSLSKGVTISSLDDGYWQRKYWQARRLPNQVSLDAGASVAKNYR